MQTQLRTFALFTLAAFTSLPAMAQTTRLLQARFDQEQDIVRRAKMLTDLSRADFQSVSEEVAAGDNTDALKTLQQFLDDAQHTSDALDAKENNPEAHPSGFKQLQIATRESLRRLDDLTAGLTGDEQAPFLAIRKNLDQLNRHLIKELFPHQPQPSVLPTDTPASIPSSQGQAPQTQPEVKP
jgi:hypothetical protein